ncbi:hypothetical protein P3L10_012521 [Capsicum annuum]
MWGSHIQRVIASFVASVESTGVFLASARYGSGSAIPVTPSFISRGVALPGWENARLWGLGNDKSVKPKSRANIAAAFQ